MDTAGLDRTTWDGVIESLEEFLPFYERVNLATTLGGLRRWRLLASRTAGRDETVLEIGPGPGTFARSLPCRRVYLLEPSRTILEYSRPSLADGRYVPLTGQAEAIPLREATLDRVFCIFSFRDFLDRGRGLEEAYRVLRPGGELHIVDLFRPPPGLQRRLMDFWLHRGATALLGLVVPPHARQSWKRDPYDELRKTYEAVGPAHTYGELMREAGFSPVEERDLLLRSVYHLQGVRPSTT